MNITPTSSGLSLIHKAENKAAEAAGKIAAASVGPDSAAGSDDFRDLERPILRLKEAEFETSAGAKLIKSGQAMIGSLLDIKV
ncbi:MAG: hypothetical protein ACU84J_02625 [Gammaproteobacteria bacterium]